MINMSENQIVNVAISGGIGKIGQLVSSFIETKDGFNTVSYTHLTLPTKA